MTADGQTTLGRFDSDDGDAADDLDDVRADVDGLMKAVQELTARHQDLADAVAALADRDGRPLDDLDADDGADPHRPATADRGFQ